MIDKDADFLRNLFIESNREVKEGYVRLESKIEHLHQCVESKVKALELTQAEHATKIAKHEHTFSLTGIFLSALGVLSGLAISFWSLFPWNKN